MGSGRLFLIATLLLIVILLSRCLLGWLLLLLSVLVLRGRLSNRLLENFEDLFVGNLLVSLVLGGIQGWRSS